MSVVHSLYNPRDSASRYSVLNGKILEVAIKPKSVQEEQDTTLVYSYNQQHIFRWIRNNLNIPLLQVHGYTEWDICQAREIIILEK